MTHPALQELIDRLKNSSQPAATDMTELEERFNTYRGITLSLCTKIVEFEDEVVERINLLTGKLNTLTVEMDKQIQFQHWFFEEMNRPEEESPTPFEPKPPLKSVK